jgi:hypothetical protein
MATSPHTEGDGNRNFTEIANLPNTAKESSKSGLTHALTIKLDEKNFLLWNQ